MIDFKVYYSQAMTDEAYMAILGDSLPIHELHYKRCKLEESEATAFASLATFHILVLTEPWCGDSLAIFPVVRKIVETNPTWDIGILLRDQNLDLIDQFLTRGGRAVPLFFFLSSDYTLQLKWGPRPAKAQQIFEDHRAMISEGKIEKSAVMKKIRSFYTRDRGKAIIAELLDLLK